eukprot:513806_1
MVTTTFLFLLALYVAGNNGLSDCEWNRMAVGSIEWPGHHGDLWKSSLQKANECSFGMWMRFAHGVLNINHGMAYDSEQSWLDGQGYPYFCAKDAQIVETKEQNGKFVSKLEATPVATESSSMPASFCFPMDKFKYSNTWWDEICFDPAYHANIGALDFDMDGFANNNGNSMDGLHHDGYITIKISRNVLYAAFALVILFVMSSCLCLVGSYKRCKKTYRSHKYSQVNQVVSSSDE